MKGRIIQVGKIDLDTAGAAYLLGLTPEDKVEVLRGCQAAPQDLTNPDVICIEVGGSGQTQLNNWDHHGKEDIPEDIPSATLQVFIVKTGGKISFPYSWDILSYRGVHSSLVNYIDQLDREGPQALGIRQSGKFPTLSDIFCGMLLMERDPVEQLYRGVEILHNVVQLRLNPYGQMPAEKGRCWTTYAEAKAENDRQVAEAVEKAHWLKTSGGLKLAWFETDFFGAPSALYGVGAQVVVAYSPHFGPAKVPKFTVAGNGVKVNVNKVLSELNARESGWGGPASGTILGSPREGSKLALKEVVEIVRKGL